MNEKPEAIRIMLESLASVLGGLELEWKEYAKERGDAPSTNTAIKYIQAYARMREAGHTPAAAAIARKRAGKRIQARNTFYFNRAAWTWGVLREMAAIVAEVKQAEYAIDVYDGYTWSPQSLERAQREWKTRFETLKQDWERFRPDALRTNHNDPEHFGDYAQLAATAGGAPKKRSKREDLKPLPDNWQERVVRQAGKIKSKFLLAICVMSLTGCRPVEVAIGVRVIQDSAGTLMFVVKGAKWKEGFQGQRWRKLVVPATGLEAGLLMESLRSSDDGQLFVQERSPKNLGAAVTRIAAAAFPAGVEADHPMPSVTAGMFRHQLSGDLKWEEMTREEIAAILGHAVTDTQHHYAGAHAGRTKRQIKAEVSGSIKDTMWIRTQPKEEKAAKPVKPTPPRPR